MCWESGLAPFVTRPRTNVGGDVPHCLPPAPLELFTAGSLQVERSVLSPCSISASYDSMARLHTGVHAQGSELRAGPGHSDWLQRDPTGNAQGCAGSRLWTDYSGGRAGPP